MRYKPTGAVIIKHILSKIRRASLFAVGRPLIVRSLPLSVHIFDRVSPGSDRPNGGLSVFGTARFDPEGFAIISEICFVSPGNWLRASLGAPTSDELSKIGGLIFDLYRRCRSLDWISRDSESWCHSIGQATDFFLGASLTRICSLINNIKPSMFSHANVP